MSEFFSKFFGRHRKASPGTDVTSSETYLEKNFTPVTPQETVQRKKTIDELSYDAIDYALSRAKGGATFIDTSGSTISGEQLANLIIAKPSTRRKWQSLSVDDLLAQKIDKGATGIVITGYSDKIQTESLQKSQDIEANIRGLATGIDPTKKKEIIVLSSSLPSIESFKADRWWFNGPFDPNNDIWSLRQEDNKVAVLANVTRKAKVNQDGTPVFDNVGIKAVEWAESKTQRFE